MSGVTSAAHTNLIGMSTQQLRNHMANNQAGSVAQQNQPNALAVQVTHLHHAQGIAAGIGQLGPGGTGLGGTLGAVGAQIVQSSQNPQNYAALMNQIGGLTYQAAQA